MKPQPWLPAESDRLRELVAAGATQREISERMARSEDTIRRYLRLLGLAEQHEALRTARISAKRSRDDAALRRDAADRLSETAQAKREADFLLKVARESERIFGRRAA